MTNDSRRSIGAWAGDDRIRLKAKNLKADLIAEAPVSIGAALSGAVRMGFMSYIGAENARMTNVSVGRFCSIAPAVAIGPTEHPVDYLSSHLFAFRNRGPFKGQAEFEDWLRPVTFERDGGGAVVIGHDVWIGRGAVIRRGVRIGHGAIIGANAVVVRDVPPYAIMGGVPARLIRHRFAPDIVARLLELGWWNYDLSRSAVPELETGDVAGCLDRLEALRHAGELLPLTPRVFKMSLTREGLEELPLGTPVCEDPGTV